MIYFDLPKGYESFKELFGMRKTSDGKLVRKNHILLQVWKDMFRNKELNNRMWYIFFVEKSLHVKSQNDLINFGKRLKKPINDYNYTFNFGYSLTSNTREIVDGGICENGATNQVRYYNHETGKFMRMKAAKLYAKSFDESELVFFGDKMKLFCAEHFASEFMAYAEDRINPKYDLHVGSNLEDFETIYTNNGDFGSCMSNDGQYSFYYDAVDASAAWLTDKDDNLVCRCVIFNKCKQYGTEKNFRIAERQYALNQDDNLKTILVKMLYKGGYIDAHKRVGAPCNRDGWREICDENGNYLDETRFSITCELECGDTLSYQDTFKEYSIKDNIAQNFGNLGYGLDETDSEFRGDEYYDDWENEYYNCYEDDMFYAYWTGCFGMRTGNVYRSNIEDYFIYVERGYYCGEYLHEDDVCNIDGEYWWNKDESVCEIDGEYYLKDDCYYCEDIEGWATDAIFWNPDGCCYANYTYSELLDTNVPDDLYDDVEENYAKENGFELDEKSGRWVKIDEAA